MIDEEFPGPAIESADPPVEVERVDPSGAVTLAGGERVVLAGLDCGSKFERWIGFDLEKKPYSWRVLRTGTTRDGAAEVYAWRVRTITLDTLPGRPATSTSSMHENVLLNLICTIREDAVDPYRARHRAFEARGVAQREREQERERAPQKGKGPITP